MIDDHWFDALNKRLTQSAPRRGILGTMTALSIAQHLGALDVAAKGGGKGGQRKGNGKGGGGKHGNKGNGKGKKDEKNDPWGCKDRFKNLRIKDPNCSEGACKSFWPDDPCEQKYCEFICNQCDGDDPHDFCIVDFPSPGSEDKDAVCCDVEATCCGSECAHLPTSLFHCGECNFPCPIGSDCLHGSCRSLCGPDGVACPEDPSLCCGQGNTCCPGFGCVNTDAHPRNCGRCGNPCGVGQSCIGGECESNGPPGWEWCETESGWFGVYTTGPSAANRLHCGGCGLECRGDFLQGEWCFAGSCGCGDDRRWCGEENGCVPDSLPC